MDIKLVEVTRDSTTGRYGNNAVITNTACYYSYFVLRGYNNNGKTIYITADNYEVTRDELNRIYSLFKHDEHTLSMKITNRVVDYKDYMKELESALDSTIGYIEDYYQYEVAQRKNEKIQRLIDNVKKIA